MTFNYLIFPMHNTFSIIINKYSHYKHLITYIHTILVNPKWQIDTFKNAKTNLNFL